MADTRSVDSKQTELTNKTAAASQKYALRQYAEAADLYSEATALQAELNGEMDLKNADLLYVYGRCLYHLGVSQSDVLGGKVAGDGSGENAGGKKKRRGKGVDGSSKQDPNTMEDIRRTKEDAQQQMQDKAAEDAVEKTAEGKQALKELEEARRAKESSKPFFQITGDADDWEDEDEDEEEDEQGDAAEEGDEGSETEDDFATAYEILDVARILLAKQAEAIAEHGKGKGKVGDELKQIRERLADTHDLQAEISLENERFADAISDSRASLELKQELFPRESSILAEAHFKLSLALEFASVTAPKDSEGHAQPGKEGQVDEAMRKEASTHMEAAIESSKLRVEKESSKMISLGPEDAEKKRKEIAEVKELIGDMEQRLEDLHNPAISMNDASGLAGAADDTKPIGGILGSLLGESPAAQKAAIEEATKEATDLTGMIRHKKTKAAESSSPAGGVNINGKRKAGDAQDGITAEDSKRARVEQPES